MTNKEIVIIKGSPRKKGNSSALAESLNKGCIDNGGQVKEFFLHNMDIKPCNACNACLEELNKKCIINDDMQQIYPFLRTADSIVIASPIYWFNISAQTKLFIDRLYGLIEPERNVMKGKKIGLILTYGDTDQFSSGAINAINSYKDMFRYMGAEIAGIVHGSASTPGEIRKTQELMDEAYNLGKNLSS